MILNGKIIDDIKKESGLLFEKAGDFVILGSLIFEKTKRNIGATTLKRLFCYINDDRKASDYTLNTLALYLGFNSWAEYISSMKIDSEWGFKDETIYIHALEVGTLISIQYLNRKVGFEVIDIEGNNVLRVTSAENSSLQVGDILYVHKIMNGEILEAEKVIRGKLVGNYKTNSEIRIIKIIIKPESIS